MNEWKHLCGHMHNVNKRLAKFTPGDSEIQLRLSPNMTDKTCIYLFMGDYKNGRWIELVRTWVSQTSPPKRSVTVVLKNYNNYNSINYILYYITELKATTRPT